MILGNKLKLSGVRKKILSAANQRAIRIQRPAQCRKILLVNSTPDETLSWFAGTVFPNAEINQLVLRKEKQDESQPPVFQVHPADFNLTGHLKNDKLVQLQTQQFDLILVLQDDSELLKYFIRTISSDLIVGKLAISDEQLCDLFIEPGTTSREYIENIVKQLNLIAPHEK